MRGALMGVLLATVACAQTGSTATQPADPAAASRPAANAPPANPDPARWWCISFGNEAVGVCHATRLACAAARGYLVATRDKPGEQLSDCIAQQDVVCFDVQDARNGKTETICHPTFATCRSHIDHFHGEDAAEKRVISGCRAMSAVPGRTIPAALALDEAAHWWCMSFAGGRMGQCDRSRPLCEDGRSFVQREFPGTPRSDCAAQRTAVCFDAEEADGSSRRMMCQPSAAICQSATEFYKRQQSGGMRVVSDCHTVE
jgi:hypothetical protein